MIILNLRRIKVILLLFFTFLRNLIPSFIRIFQTILEICPAKAIKGLNWSIKIERDSFYNPYDCEKMVRKRSMKIGIDQTLCGLCILECPWTKKIFKFSMNQKIGLGMGKGYSIENSEMRWLKL